VSTQAEAGSKVTSGHLARTAYLEVSRVARNNADWHRLLEICALAGTLICDEDGLDDPADFDVRLRSASRAP
jgi:DNA invertase Pin-like site-specific DNA recombinase